MSYFLMAIQKPWGNYQTIDSGKGYKVKRIEVVPRKQLSYQYHNHRSEHWIVVQGSAEVLVEGLCKHLLQSGEVVDIPIKKPHRVKNPSADELLVFIEVQQGEYLEEDDIVRLEDDFGRVATAR